MPPTNRPIKGFTSRAQTSRSGPRQSFLGVKVSGAKPSSASSRTNLADFDSIATRRAIFSNARNRLASTESDAEDSADGELAWGKTTSGGRLTRAAVSVRASIRQTLIQRTLATAMLSGDGITREERRMYKAKIEGTLAAMEATAQKSLEKGERIHDLRDHLEELRANLDPSQFSNSVEEIQRILKRIHGLEDQITMGSSEGSLGLAVALDEMKDWIPQIVEGVRSESKWRQAKKVVRVNTIGRPKKRHLAHQGQSQCSDQESDEDKDTEETKMRSTVKNTLRMSDTWSRIGDDAGQLVPASPAGSKASTWLHWWPDRENDGLDKHRQEEFFASFPEDRLTEEELELRQTIFNYFADLDKEAVVLLTDLAAVRSVIRCMHDIFPDFITLEDWIEHRQHVAEHACSSLHRRTIAPVAPEWSDEVGGPQLRRHLESPMVNQMRDSRTGKAKPSALGLAFHSNERGQTCCTLAGPAEEPGELPWLRPSTGVQQKSFHWIQKIGEKRELPGLAHRAGLMNVEEVLAWRVKHRHRPRQVGPEFRDMWQVYDRRAEPESKPCQCEWCAGNLTYVVHRSKVVVP